MAMSLLTNLSCTKHGCFLKAWRSPKRLVKEPKVPSPQFYFVDRSILIHGHRVVVSCCDNDRDGTSLLHDIPASVHRRHPVPAYPMRVC
jgi:hypothetical protein